jgi:hypothetical protein
LNVGDTDGVTGYGLRSNAGDMEFRNDGGSWTAIGTGGGTVDGRGAASRIAYWSDSDTLTSDGSFTFDGTTLSVDAPAVFNDGNGAGNDFRVETSGKKHALFVDASTDQVLILSGVGPGPSKTVGPDEAAYTDVNFFVSGSRGSRESATQGTALFGGDVVASGSVYVGSGSAAGATAFTVVHSYDPGSGDSFENQLANNEAGGRIVHFGSGSLGSGRLYYLHTDATWTLADADAASSGATQLLGIPLGASATQDGVLLEGFARIQGSGGGDRITGTPSIGAPVYVDTTAGNVALTAPSAAGDFVRVIGYCVDFNGAGDILLYFKPDATSIELS